MNNIQKKTKHASRRRRLLTLIFAGLCSLLMLAWTVREEIQEKIYSFVLTKDGQSYNVFRFRRNDSIINNTALIIDTSGCRIPKLDPWDPSIVNLVKLLKPYKCPGVTLPITTAPNGSLVLDKSATGRNRYFKENDFSCTYQGIRRSHEKAGSNREVNIKYTIAKPLHFGEDLKEDFVKVECVIKGFKAFQHFYPLARLKESVESFKSRIKYQTPRLNVLLIGIDSVSKLNFLRHLQKTHTFLFQNMSPFDMKGYTKVGENTFPNLIPMLTGHFHEFYFNDSLRNTMFWDDVELVWKYYASKGYRTFYAEDMPIYGTFQYEKRGFHDPPTDYYFRPLALAIHFSRIKKRSKEFCLNSQFELDIIYNYLKDFVQVMDTRPFFAFAMESTITHDMLNYARYIDDPTVRLLEDLQRYGTLNKTALIFFSDHGLRFGPIRKTYIGKFEERMPFMYIHFPKWFLNQHPNIAKNLLVNQKRLMTLFDVHETLLDLLALQTGELEVNSTSRLGQSLLQEIPENRTCSDANIIPHWCPCQTHVSVPLTNTTVIKSAEEIVKNINGQLDKHKKICATLNVSNITDAQLTHANTSMWVNKKKDKSKDVRLAGSEEEIKPIDRYLVTLTTNPGGAMFEGTVQHNPDGNIYRVLGISRINMYGNQSECIDIHRSMISIRHCFNR